MTRTQRASILSSLFLGFSLTGQVALANTTSGTQPIQNNHRSGSQPVAASLLNLPIQFEANEGQVDESVKFLARGQGYNLFLTPTESVMVLTGREASSVKSEAGSAPTEDSGYEMQEYKHSVVRMKLEGANPSPAIDGMEQLPGIVNYFIGNDPAKWRTKIPTYAKVHYKDAYPGIDLAYYGNQGKLEYDFIVAPGADPDQIKLAFEGASAITVADSGDLLLTTALGEVQLQKPVVYQVEKDGHKTLVAGNYTSVQDKSNSVKIQLAAYDRARALIIDPVLLYSTFVGGSGLEAGNEFGPQGVAVDAMGNAYIAGATASPDFVGISGSALYGYGGGTADAYVIKFNSTGSAILWATYVGGTAYDRAAAVALDPTGNAYITGLTLSTSVSVATFPTTPGAFQRSGPPSKAFVTKISSDGTTLIYSTLIGGSNSDRDIGWGIAVDSSGHAYVTGEARGNWPTTTGAFQTSPADSGTPVDTFVTKFNQTGTGLVYSTLVGGSVSDAALGIAIDNFGNAYVTGFTTSPNFPGASSSSFGSTFMAGPNDAFAFKLNTDGTSLVWSTYLGGTGDDIGRAITVDTAGNAYATGQTYSANFPITPGSAQTFLGSAGQYDAYVSKINGVGGLVYSTYLGNTAYDGGWAIAVNSAGQVYVAGRGAGSGFPGLVPLQDSPIATTSGFLSKLNSSGSGVEYTVFIGPTGATTEAFGIALDASENVYLTGWTRSPNFPLKDALKTTLGGTIDDFFIKIGNKPIAHAGPDQPVSMGTVVTLDGTGSSGGSLTYQWTQVPGGPAAPLSEATTAHPTFTAPNVPPAGATVTFQLIVCEGTSSNCSESDTVNVHISNVNQRPVAQAAGPATVQEGSPVVLDGTASYDPDMEPLTYAWHQVFGTPVTLAYPNTATPSFTAPPVGAGGGSVEFELTVTDPRTLSSLPGRVSINISNVNQPPVAEAGADQTKNEQTLVTLDGSGSQDPDLDGLSYSWTQTGGPSVSLTGANTASPTFTAPNVAAGGVVLTFQLIVNDGHVSSVADTVQVAVVNVNDPPVCSLAQASPNLLWPPNHTMTQVSIVGLTDPQNQTITITYPTVTQDEPIKGLGDGDTSPDAAVSGNDILLRAERAGTGNGRVYVVHFTATNTDGAQCSGTVTVSVPHDKKDPAVGGPQLYNSFGP